MDPAVFSDDKYGNGVDLSDFKPDLWHRTFFLQETDDQIMSWAQQFESLQTMTVISTLLLCMYYAVAKSVAKSEGQKIQNLREDVGTLETFIQFILFLQT